MTRFDLSQTDHLLTTTRAVRKRLDLSRPVERDVILECVRIATQAPAGSNIQRWRWVIVDDPEKKQLVAAAYRKVWDVYSQASPAAALSPEQMAAARLDRIGESATFLADHLHEVPAMVIPCMVDRLPDGAAVAESAGYYGSILPAVWSFMLAARSRGIGSAWTTMHLVHEQEVSEALGIPPTAMQTALIPIGYYTGDDFRPGLRRPAEDVTYFNTWGEKAWS